MYAMPIDEVMKLKSLVDHQTLLQQGKLVRVDANEDRPVVFLSHQWVSFDGPDPEFEQFRQFQEAVKAVLGGLKVGHSPVMRLLNIFDADRDGQDLKKALEACVVWYDYFCIFQPTSPLAKGCQADTFKNLEYAVDSIPYYVAKSAHFLVLSPPTRHVSTNQVCDAMAYKQRGWCRVELNVWNVVSGGQPTVVITNSHSLTKMPIPSVLAAPKIGHGEFTCCTRFANHTIEDEHGRKTTIPCDKEKLAPGLLALHARATECYKEIGDMQKYRLNKALWRVPLLGLPGVDPKFDEQPTKWTQFCHEFELNEKYPMHLSTKQLKELCCAQPLVYAVCSLNVPMVKMILAGGGKANSVIGLPEHLRGLNICGSVVGWTALHFAAISCTSEYGNESSSILKMLTDSGANPYKLSKNGFSAMHTSIVCHNDFFVTWMMKNYRSFGIDRSIDYMGDSILHTACMQGNLKLIRAAHSAGADMDARGIFGSSPLSSLCMSPVDVSYQQHPTTIMKWALDNGVISHVNDLRQGFKASFKLLFFRAILAACRCEYRLRGSNAKALAKMGSIKVSFANAKGCTLLHGCCANGSSTEFMKFLIDQKADVHAKNAIGRTPMDFLVGRGKHIKYPAHV